MFLKPKPEKKELILRENIEDMVDVEFQNQLATNIKIHIKEQKQKRSEVKKKTLGTQLLTE